jgi:RHS repeat-associated protein
MDHSRFVYFERSDYRFGFNGQEKDNEIKGTGNSLDFGARVYDSRLGKMLSIDPRVADYPWQSSYAYFKNSPISQIDYKGAGESPIYDNKTGELMGADDEGLTGDAISMPSEKYTKGMNHSEAIRVGKVINTNESADCGDELACAIVDKIKYSKENILPKRPDYDGKLTIAEARDWYRNGGGQPLFVDASKISLFGVSAEELKINNPTYVNFAHPRHPNLETGIIYGTIQVTLIDGLNFTAKLGGKNGYLDTYNFEVHNGQPLRNLLTKLGKFANGEGTDYQIFNYGYAKISPLTLRK